MVFMHDNIPSKCKQSSDEKLYSLQMHFELHADDNYSPFLLEMRFSVRV